MRQGIYRYICIGGSKAHMLLQCPGTRKQIQASMRFSTLMSVHPKGFNACYNGKQCQSNVLLPPLSICFCRVILDRILYS